MPVHDWSHVNDGVFHDFYLSWHTHLSAELNLHELPRGNYSMVERKFDFDTVEEPDAPYHRLDRRLVIRRETDHRMVSLVEVVSPHHKNSPQLLDQFCEGIASELREDISVTVIDLFPPRRFDPMGIHSEIWHRSVGEASPLPDTQPFIVVTYHPISELRAYLEPVALREEVPDIPLFLDPEHYVNAPLESTYMTAYRGIPAYWRDVIEND